MNSRIVFATVFIFCCVVASSSQAAVPKKSDSVQAAKQFPEGEEILYTRILEQYRKGNIEELQKLANKLTKLFPHSVYCDNALYFTGLAMIEKGIYGPAIKLFDRIEEQYPLGNKRVAAIYAKSAIYKKLNLPQLSQMMLEKVVRVYPGTPEALRAQMELKQLKHQG